MLTSMPPFYQKLLTEGRTYQITEEVLTQSLLPDEHSDDRGLIYMSPELVSDIKKIQVRVRMGYLMQELPQGTIPFCGTPHVLVPPARGAGIIG